MRLKTTLKSCEDDVAQLSDGESFPFGMIVWTAGVKPNPALDATDLPRGPKGHVVANSRLQVVREDGSWVRGAWAAGDIAQIPDTTKKQQPAFYPPNAQNALRQAVLLGESIPKAIRRRRPRPYVHYTLGTVASYGLLKGAANIHGIQLKDTCGLARPPRLPPAGDADHGPQDPHPRRLGRGLRSGASTSRRRTTSRIRATTSASRRRRQERHDERRQRRQRPGHPSQAEGEDPADEPEIVLEPEGKPSQAEGDDPDHRDEHEVLDPAEPD